MLWPQRSPNPLSEIAHGLWGSLKTPVINKDHMLMVEHRSTMYIANKSPRPKTSPWDSPKRRSQNEWIACADAKSNIPQATLCSSVVCPQKVNLCKRMVRTALSCISEVVILRQFMACTIFVEVLAVSACKTANWVSMIFGSKYLIQLCKVKTTGDHIFATKEREKERIKRLIRRYIAAKSQFSMHKAKFWHCCHEMMGRRPHLSVPPSQHLLCHASAWLSHSEKGKKGGGCRRPPLLLPSLPLPGVVAADRGHHRCCRWPTPLQPPPPLLAPAAAAAIVFARGSRRQPPLLLSLLMSPLPPVHRKPKEEKEKRRRSAPPPSQASLSRGLSLSHCRLSEEERRRRPGASSLPAISLSHSLSPDALKGTNAKKKRRGKSKKGNKGKYEKKSCANDRNGSSNGRDDVLAGVMFMAGTVQM
ncbi:hypothetical protein Taro_041154, partial [Colocasia esculenta]|nr:hypothetical protein [Colocasia esculenta]